MPSKQEQLDLDTGRALQESIKAVLAPNVNLSLDSKKKTVALLCQDNSKRSAYACLMMLNNLVNKPGIIQLDKQKNLLKTFAEPLKTIEKIQNAVEKHKATALASLLMTKNSTLKSHIKDFLQIFNSITVADITKNNINDVTAMVSILHGFSTINSDKSLPQDKSLARAEEKLKIDHEGDIVAPTKMIIANLEQRVREFYKANPDIENKHLSSSEDITRMLTPDNLDTPHGSPSIEESEEHNTNNHLDVVIKSSNAHNDNNATGSTDDVRGEGIH